MKIKVKRLPAPWDNYGVTTDGRVWSFPRQMEKSFTKGLGKRKIGGHFIRRNPAQRYHLYSNGKGKFFTIEQLQEMLDENR